MVCVKGLEIRKHPQPPGEARNSKSHGQRKSQALILASGCCFYSGFLLGMIYHKVWEHALGEKGRNIVWYSGCSRGVEVWRSCWSGGVQSLVGNP